MRRVVLTALAGSLALTGIFGLGYFYLDRPNVLRVAVTRNSDSARVLSAMNEAFLHDSRKLRFKFVPMQDFMANATAMEAGLVDLAVVRSDIAMPPSGQTLAILYREAAVFMAPAGSRLTKVSGLSGQRVGVVRGVVGGMGNANLLSSVLAQYDTAPGSVTVVPLAPSDLPKAVRDHLVDVVLVVGAPTGSLVQDAVTAMTQNGDGPPVFIPVSEAGAIAERSPIFEAREIVAGTFGGSPQRPVESVDTLGVTVRLVARATLGEQVAADVVRHMFAVRPAIAINLPLANKMEAPSTDKGQALPTHPGAAAFFDGEEQTFLDKNSDYIYLMAMLASLVASGFAAVASRVGRQSHGAIENHLEHLLLLMRDARKAQDIGTLERIDDEAHQILTLALERSNLNNFDAGRATAFTLAFDRVCSTIQDRKRQLLDETASAVPSAGL